MTAGPSPPKNSDNTESLDGDNTEDGIIWLNNYLLKDSFNPFLHPSQVKESDSSFSSVWPSV